MEYNAKVISAETIASVLAGKSEDKTEAEKPIKNKNAGKTTKKKSIAKTATKTQPKKQVVEKRKAIIPMLWENRKYQNLSTFKNFGRLSD